jgi:hypothetical protein
MVYIYIYILYMLDYILYFYNIYTINSATIEQAYIL